MSVIAVYNMKGGVGKTTTAVNLSYLCAAAGQRTLLWDLDPQAASSFAFRVRPHVEGSGRRRGARARLRRSHQADRLRQPRPAAGGFRLSQARPAARSPRQAGARDGRLLAALGASYDAVVLDCPAGCRCHRGRVRGGRRRAGAHHPDGPLAAHGRATDCLGGTRRSRPRRRRVFQHGRSPQDAAPANVRLVNAPSGAVPVQPGRLLEPRRADGGPARAAARLRARRCGRGRVSVDPDRSAFASPAGGSPRRAHFASNRATGAGDRVRHRRDRERCSERGGTAGLSRRHAAPEGAQVVHRFDTDDRHLELRGYVLELYERSGIFRLVVATSDGIYVEGPPHASARAEVQIDARWATQILSRLRSPLDALERRSTQPLRVPGSQPAIAGRRTTAPPDRFPAGGIAGWRLRASQLDGRWPDPSPGGRSSPRTRPDARADIARAAGAPLRSP